MYERDHHASIALVLMDNSCVRSWVPNVCGIVPWAATPFASPWFARWFWCLLLFGVSLVQMISTLIAWDNPWKRMISWIVQ